MRILVGDSGTVCPRWGLSGFEKADDFADVVEELAVFAELGDGLAGFAGESIVVAIVGGLEGFEVGVEVCDATGEGFEAVLLVGGPGVGGFEVELFVEALAGFFELGEARSQFGNVFAGVGEVFANEAEAVDEVAVGFDRGAQSGEEEGGDGGDVADGADAEGGEDVEAEGGGDVEGEGEEEGAVGDGLGVADLFGVDRDVAFFGEGGFSEDFFGLEVDVPGDGDDDE